MCSSAETRVNKWKLPDCESNYGVEMYALMRAIERYRGQESEQNLVLVSDSLSSMKTIENNLDSGMDIMKYSIGIDNGRGKTTGKRNKNILFTQSQRNKR